MRIPAVTVAVTLSLSLLSACGHAGGPPGPSTPSGRDMGLGGVATGAVDSLQPSDSGGRHVTDVAEMLRGRVPGLEVVRGTDGDISLRIRGGDSILSEGEPLIILDDAPVSEGSVSMVLRGLNPNEVASIQVLKDVASTAVYGTRGAHGVIIIRMKHRKP